MSELEAGHPNMTLLEALACGLPIVGTLESDLNGMEVVERDFQKGVAGLSKILNNYEAYQKAGLECAEKLSWKNRCLSLLEIFKSNKMNSLNIFKNKLDSSIKKLKKLDHDKDNKFLLDNNFEPSYFPSFSFAKTNGIVGYRKKVSTYTRYMQALLTVFVVAVTAHESAVCAWSVVDCEFRLVVKADFADCT